MAELPAPSLDLVGPAVLSLCSGGDRRKGTWRPRPTSDHSPLRLSPIRSGHASPHELPPLPLRRGSRLPGVTDVAAAAISKPEAADWLNPAHNVDDDAHGAERNRYPRSTNDTASSPSRSTTYSAHWMEYTLFSKLLRELKRIPMQNNLLLDFILPPRLFESWVCPRAVVDSSSVVNGDISGVSSQQGWRTTHNHTSRLPRSLLGMTATNYGIESGSSGPSNQGHESAAGDNNNSFSAATTTRSASLRNRTTRICKGKRKHTSSSYHPGESSSSLNEHSGSCLAPSDTTAGRNHATLCHDTPVIDIDDISSPEVRPSLSRYRGGTSIDPNISAQLEADEMLARQLQEQLYNETPRVAPREEIDAIVAMSLQHEEDAGRTSRPVRRFQNDTRASRASRLSAAIRARYETEISHMRNAAPITLGLRAIVAGYPSRHIQPNIDLNDYDALLALDENNHQHTGASESQINNLPQSVFQSTSSEEPCAVCLENPSTGDTIRTLPCFHKFHKDCIDEWLRRKKLCPVCKCGITRS